MTALDRAVAVSRWQLRRNIVHEAWVALAAVAGATWALAITTERLLGLGVNVWQVGAVLAGAAAIGGLLPGIWRRIRPVDAAVAIDLGAGLKERLSSAVSLQNSQDLFAQATVADAETVAATLHVPTHVPLRRPGRIPVAVVATTIAVALAWLLPAYNLLARGDNGTSTEQQTSQIAQAEKNEVLEAYEQQRQRIKELTENNPALKDLELKLEPLDIPDTDKLTPDELRKETVKRLNSAADQLAARRDEDRKELADSLRKMLSQVESQSNQDPSSNLSEALQSGDLRSAQQQLGEMQKQLKDAAHQAADPQMAQKMQEMQQKLQEVSKQLQQASNASRMQKELENKGGLSAEDAKKLLQKLSKLDPKEAAKQMQEQLSKQGMSAEQAQELARKLAADQQAQQQLQQLAQNLGQAAQQLQSQMQSQQAQGQQGQNSQQSEGANAAAGALADAANQLSQMELSEQLLNDVEAQLSELNSLKDSMLGQGDGNGPSSGEPGMGRQGSNYGQGYGAGIGKERVPFQYKPSKANTRVQGGQIIAQLLVDGPQMRGEASAEVRDAVAAAARDAEDAVERGAIPRQYHNVTRRYFEALAGLRKDGITNSSPAKAADEKPANP